MKMAVSTYLSVLTLNVNGLNVPIKKHRVADWIKKQEATICCLKESRFRTKDTHRLKLRGWKKILHANTNDKQIRVAILRQNRL